MGWLLDAINSLFSWIPNLVWNALVWLWDALVGPVLQWICVDFFWNTIVAYLRTLLRFKAFFMAAVSFAYAFLKEYFEKVFMFLIDTAFDLADFFFSMLDIDLSGSTAQSLVYLFKYYDIVNAWVPLSEGIVLFGIYLGCWALMMLCKISLKIWQAVPGT